MSKKFFSKLILWIVFVIIVIAVIPFLIVSKNKKQPASKNEIDVYFHKTDKIEKMKLDDYIIGVVTAEMPASFHKEALKAQAVATRSYTLSKINVTGNNDTHKGADICTSFEHCQAYTSKKEAYDNWGKNAREYYKKIVNAVNETSDEIITYEGNVINAVFHASNGGKTENSKDIWGGDIPYLSSVLSFGEENAPKFKSEVIVSLNDFKQKLTNEYTDIVFDTLIGDIIRSEGGGVKEIQIGNKRIKGTKIRQLFNLNSANFDVQTNGDKVIFSVMGHGHGVGMSQYGANAMAMSGKNYDEILKTYYKNTEIIKYNMP